MVINDPAVLVNAAICVVIACALVFHQRRGVRHHPGISILAYLPILIYASISLRFIFGLHVQPHWLVVMANVMICTTVLWVRGRVACLTGTLRH